MLMMIAIMTGITVEILLGLVMVTKTLPSLKMMVMRLIMVMTTMALR